MNENKALRKKSISQNTFKYLIFMVKFETLLHVFEQIPINFVDNTNPQYKLFMNSQRKLIISTEYFFIILLLVK